jgi:hypothetical protein
MTKKSNLPEIENLKGAVEGLHHCKATFVESVEVIETFRQKTVWEGIVSVFALKGHPQADKCYAWSSPIQGSTKRKFFAVLGLPPVLSVKDAVRAAIVQEYKSGSKE